MSLLIAIASTASAVALVTAYYTLVVQKKPKVHAGSDGLKRFLSRHVPTLESKYSPSPLYFEGRLQTVLGLLYRFTTPSFFPYHRELFTLKDGGQIALDFAQVQTPPDGKSVVVVFFPGLTSSSQACYVRTLVTSLNEVGASVVVFNNRGLGGIPFKTPRTYSASNTEDAQEVIQYLRKKYPEQRMIALGTSLGGMVLSKYLITHPKEAKEIFDSAILISIAWDANAGTANLENNFINRHLINKELTKSLVNLAKKFLKCGLEIPPNFDIKAVLKSKTVRDFDAAVTAPQFGFASVEEYYKSATTNGQVHKFPIPVFALSAEDDPMSPGEHLPLDEANAKGSKLALVVTTYGGHLGFLEGTGKRRVHFMERFMSELVLGIRTHGMSDL